MKYLLLLETILTTVDVVTKLSSEIKDLISVARSEGREITDDELKNLRQRNNTSFDNLKKLLSDD